MKVKHEELRKKYQQEEGEERLAQLIKEAGETARARKKEVMETHFQKLREAVNGTTTSLSGKAK